MADYKVTDTNLTSIANAIRTKTGKSSSMAFPDEFVSEINSISTGGTTLITKSISENGTYSASSDNADGYSSVTVSVPMFLEKLYTYTVQESWENSYHTSDMISAVLDGYLSASSVEYLLVFNNNTSTSSYRVDAMIVCSTALTVSDLLNANNTSVIAWRNYYATRTLGLDSSVKATQGTTIDVYRALHT